MPLADTVRTTLAFLGLLLLVVWLPIAAVTYLPGWHAASCNWQPRCDDYGRASALQRIDELRHFMQHRGQLSNFAWTEKETTHLTEVRGMLEKLATFALLGGLIFAHTEREKRARLARWAMLCAASGIIVLPFFGTFWKEIFHPLLFDNALWSNTPADTSWWIMPRVYFHYTTGLVIGTATLLCALLRLQAMQKSK